MRAASAGCAFPFSQHLSTRRRTQCAECCTHGMHMHGRGHAQTPRRAQSVPTEHGNGDARAACIRKRSTECATVREPRGRSGVCAGRQFDVRARLHGRPAWRSEGRRMRPLRWRWRLVREYPSSTMRVCSELLSSPALHDRVASTTAAGPCSGWRRRVIQLSILSWPPAPSACAVGLRRRPAPSACAVGLRRRPPSSSRKDTAQSVSLCAGVPRLRRRHGTLS